MVHGTCINTETSNKEREKYRDYLKHISLQPPQHVRSQQFVQPFHLLFLADVGKLVLEHCQVVELLRSQEVQQVEQLFQVVLQGSSCQ